jgi:AcrR family transcriptional regulator
VIESGLTALSLRTVAARADVHTSAIGYHFGNKQGLIDALIRSLEWEGEEEMQEALAGIPRGRDRLHAYMDDYKAFATNVDFWRLLLALVPATNTEASAFPEAMRRMYAHDQILLDLAQDDLTRERSLVLIDFIFATIEGVALQFILNERELDVPACFALLERAVAPLYLELLDGGPSAGAHSRAGDDGPRS